MRLAVYTVFNSLTRRNEGFMSFPTDGFAVKQCSQILANQGLQSEHAQLFRYEGFFDDETGEAHVESQRYLIPWDTVALTEFQGKPETKEEFQQSTAGLH